MKFSIKKLGFNIKFLNAVFILKNTQAGPSIVPIKVSITSLCSK